MFDSAKYLLFASALFLATGTARAAEEDSAPVAPSVPHAIVKCPGITSVAMTADAEQVLPLRLVGTLACGESVVVLSDTQGYTAHIRWKYAASIAISNQGEATVEVIPGIVTLDELQPNLRALSAAEPEELAHNHTHQVLWAMANAQPSSSAVELHSADSTPLSALSYRNNPAPDYLSPYSAPASGHPAAFARTESVDVRTVALKNVSLPEGQITAGVMWFARDSRARELSLRIPAGDLVFDFPLSFQQKK